MDVVWEEGHAVVAAVVVSCVDKHGVRQQIDASGELGERGSGVRIEGKTGVRTSDTRSYTGID